MQKGTIGFLYYVYIVGSASHQRANSSAIAYTPQLVVVLMKLTVIFLSLFNFNVVLASLPVRKMQNQNYLFNQSKIMGQQKASEQ